MSAPVREPIFVCGYGRSGTTLAVRILGVHPDVAWFSGWTNRFPRCPQLAFASRIQRLGAIERWTRGLRRLPRPAEAYAIWDLCFPGFSSAGRDWGSDESDAAGHDRFRTIVLSHLRYQGGRRFLTKYTGWPRFDFVRRSFPDARFVFCDRDPRAVVHSAMKQRWGLRRRPEVFESMAWNERLDRYVDWYLGLHSALGRYEEGRDYERLRYEALVGDPVTVFRGLCGRLSLEWTPRFARVVASWPVRTGADRAWSEALPERERRYLEERLGAALDAYRGGAGPARGGTTAREPHGR